jgi:hypothetical protein
MDVYLNYNHVNFLACNSSGSWPHLVVVSLGKKPNYTYHPWTDHGHFVHPVFVIPYLFIGAVAIQLGT